MNLKPIETKEEYEQALARLSSLMDKEFVEGSAEAVELDMLVLIIGNYEDEHYPLDSKTL